MEQPHLHTFEHVGKFKPGKPKPVTAIITTKKQYKKLLKRQKKGKDKGPILPPMLRAHLYRCNVCGHEVYIPSDPALPPQCMTSVTLPGH